MVIAGTVEPRIGYKSGRVDDQGVSLKTSVRPSHPAVGRRILGSLFVIFLHENGAQRMLKLVHHHDVVLALNNLKREGQIVGPWEARAITLELRVACIVAPVVTRDIDNHALLGVSLLFR